VRLIWNVRFEPICVAPPILAGRVVSGEGEPERRFATMPSELRRPSIWLVTGAGCGRRVMESTAQYWRSVWLELEPHMRLHLAQAFSNRAPRGRKHDFKDAERRVRRLIANELILSFVPGGEQHIWHNLTRMKTQLTRDRVRLHRQTQRHDRAGDEAASRGGDPTGGSARSGSGFGAAGDRGSGGEGRHISLCGRIHFLGGNLSWKGRKCRREPQQSLCEKAINICGGC